MLHNLKKHDRRYNKWVLSVGTYHLLVLFFKPHLRDLILHAYLPVNEAKFLTSFHMWNHRHLFLRNCYCDSKRPQFIKFTLKPHPADIWECNSSRWDSYHNCLFHWDLPAYSWFSLTHSHTHTSCASQNGSYVKCEDWIKYGDSGPTPCRNGKATV